MDVPTIKTIAFDLISELTEDGNCSKEEISIITLFAQRLIFEQSSRDTFYETLQGVFHDSTDEPNNSTDEPTESITNDSETSDDAWDELKEAEEQTMKEVVPDPEEVMEGKKNGASKKDIPKLVSLVKAGWTTAKMADEFQVNNQTIYQWKYEARKLGYQI